MNALPKSLAGQQATRNARPARAGFIKLCPSPPNACLTTIIANIAPNIGTHNGALAGMFIPSKSPVTAAVKSPIFPGLLSNLSIKNSVITADAVAAKST